MNEQQPSPTCPQFQTSLACTPGMWAGVVLGLTSSRPTLATNPINQPRGLSEIHRSWTALLVPGCLYCRLQDKSRIIEATVFLHDMSAFAEMDAVWRAYIPEGCGPSRAAVGVSLGGDVMVEMKVSAAAPAVGLGTTPTTTKAKKKGGPKRGKTS